MVLACPCLSSSPPKSAKQLQGRSNQYEATFASGKEYKQSGDFNKALEYFKKAFVIALKSDIKSGELDCIREQGLMYWNLGKISESSAEFAKGLSLAKELHLNSAEAYCASAIRIADYYLKGKDCRSAKDYECSIKEFRLAIAEAKRVGSREHELKCLRQLSLTYWEITRLQEFYSLNRDALIIAENINHRQEQTKCLNNLGLFYWKLDNYSEALKYLQRAYELAVVIESPQSQAESLANIGIVYFDSGEYDKAMGSLDKALSIDKKLANSADVAKDLINIGESYRLRGLLTANKNDFSQCTRKLS